MMATLICTLLFANVCFLTFDDYQSNCGKVIPCGFDIHFLHNKLVRRVDHSELFFLRSIYSYGLSSPFFADRAVCILGKLSIAIHPLSPACE